MALGKLGKYELVARLGVGGMAEVFRARALGAEGFARPVAIKRVLAGFSESPAFASMFITEARLSARLHHPNIVAVTDFDRDDDGRLFLVMELVEGKDLSALIHTGRLSPAVIIHVVVEVLRGLGYAHDLPAGDDGVRGLIHRDVSPHNVLLSWDGAVKISDFGIAKAREASDATASAVLKGKPAYMSPEQATGAAIDGRSDLFAVGTMLWELLAGKRLFYGGTTAEMLSRVLFAPIPSPSSVRHDVPADLEAVAMRLLARDRDQRYRTAGDAIDALLACRDASLRGSAELSDLLATRFPGDAPTRPRVGRSVESAAPVGNHTLPLDEAALRDAVTSGTDGVASASTVIATPSARSRRWLRWPIVLAASAAVGASSWLWLAKDDRHQASAAPPLPTEVTDAAAAEVTAAEVTAAGGPDAGLVSPAPVPAPDAAPVRPFRRRSGIRDVPVGGK